MNTRGEEKHTLDASRDLNLDGAIRDSDIFVLGDEDDVEDVGLEGSSPTVAPPSYSEVQSSSDSSRARDTPSLSRRDKSEQSPRLGVKGRYYIEKNDTLNGISLKLGLDVRIPVILFPLV